MTNLSRFLFCITVCLLLPGISLGHSPHHVITDVAVSPAQDSGIHAFILITDQVFRAEEPGSSWKNLVNGLNNQNSFTSLSVSPDYKEDKTLYVASDGDGVYRSTDGGDSWHKVVAGLDDLGISKLSISANFNNDHRLLAAVASGGVWRSDDGGNNWHRVLTESVSIVDFAEVSGLEEQSIVYAGDSMGRVWRSADNGRLWEVIYELPEAIAISSIAGKANELFLGTRENGLYRSNDSGLTFSRVEQLQSLRRKDCRGNDLAVPVADSYITSVEWSSGDADGSRIFVTTWYDGVFVSVDHGNTWSLWNDGLSCDPQADDMAVPHFRDIAIAHMDNGEAMYWLAAFDGLFVGAGDNSPWQRLETLPLGLIKGTAVASGKGKSLAIALGTYGGGFYLSEDRGTNWTIGNQGLVTTRLTDLSFSTEYSASGVIYAGASGRLLRSSDHGSSWQRISLQKTGFGRRVLNKLGSWGVPTAWLRSSDSVGSSRVYPTFIVTIPGPGTDRVLFATRSHGVMAFDGLSESVESVWSGTNRLMNSLTISPDFERDNTLFSSIRGESLLRSEDGGISWVAVNNGLEFVQHWTDDPEGGGLRRDIYVAISPDFEIDHTLFAGSPAGDGLYVSHDRGNSWTRVAMGSGELPAPVLAIAVSPDFQTDNMLIVSVKGQGLFRSEDRGLHFDVVGEQLIAANASIELLDFSPGFSNDQSVVAASDENLFMSEDRGDTWSIIQRPVRYEDMRDVVLFAGDWDQQSGEQYSAMTETLTSSVGDTASLRFVGGGIRWLGSRGPEFGNAEVYIDGELVDSVRCYSSELENMQELFVSQELEFGAHTIEVRLVSEQVAGTSAIIGVDGFDVLPARITTH